MSLGKRPREIYLGINDFRSTFFQVGYFFCCSVERGVVWSHSCLKVENPCLFVGSIVYMTTYFFCVLNFGDPNFQRMRFCGALFISRAAHGEVTEREPFARRCYSLRWCFVNGRCAMRILCITLIRWRLVWIANCFTACDIACSNVFLVRQLYFIRLRAVDISC